MPIPPIAIKLAIWALVIFSIIGVIWLGVHSIYDNGYDDGTNKERIKWQDKENENLAKHNAKVVELQKQAGLVAAEYAKYVGNLESEYTGRIENGNKQKQTDIANAVSGALKLRITKSLDTNRPSNGGTGQARIAGGAGECNGPETIELPAKVTSDLYELANDANANTDQLTLAQQIIVKLQSICRKQVVVQ